MSIKVAQKWFDQKIEDFDTLTKTAQNVGDLGKIIVATCFEKLPKVQKIFQSGHTGHERELSYKTLFIPELRGWQKAAKCL